MKLLKVLFSPISRPILAKGLYSLGLGCLIIAFVFMLSWNDRVYGVFFFGLLGLGLFLCVSAPLILPGPWPNRLRNCFVGALIPALLWLLVYLGILVFFVRIG